MGIVSPTTNCAAPRSEKRSLLGITYRGLVETHGCADLELWATEWAVWRASREPPCVRSLIDDEMVFDELANMIRWLYSTYPRALEKAANVLRPMLV